MEKEGTHNCIDLEEIKANIKQYGLSVIMIEATDYLPSFAYSVGLKETLRHPELICFGLNIDLLKGLINDVTRIIKNKGAFSKNQDYSEIFKNSRAQFIKVDPLNIEDYFGVAIKYYGGLDFEALQLVWTDRNNKFPWEDGFEEVFKYKQPLLDRNADFKFREEKNLAVFTTPQWLEQNEPIVRVLHDEDGDWQFFTKEIDFENGKVVALKQMILKDPSLNELFDLEYGEEAERDYVGGKWTRNMM